MRSLFHFPLPAQPPSQQTSPTATAPLQPEMCHRPHPAPMHRQRRSPALLSAARSHRAPSPEYRPAAACTASPASRPSRAVARIASTPLRAAIRIPLCRHRADPALIAPPSRPSCAAAVLHVLRFAVRIAPTVRRHPHRAPSLSSRCGGPRALTGKNRTVCIPFSPNARKRPPSWQHPPEMHAFRDQDGNILALCVHSRAQSGDSGCMARESCRQGPSFASRNPKSRMARRCCQRCAAFPRQRPAVRPNGLCALRRGPGLLAACAPRHLARVHRRRLTRAALRRPRPATRSPYRCISPPARRTHPASRAHPPRPGNKRNSTNNSMRA